MTMSFLLLKTDRLYKPDYTFFSRPSVPYKLIQFENEKAYNYQNFIVTETFSRNKRCANM